MRAVGPPKDVELSQHTENYKIFIYLTFSEFFYIIFLRKLRGFQICFQISDPMKDADFSSEPAKKNFIHLLVVSRARAILVHTMPSMYLYYDHYR